MARIQDLSPSLLLLIMVFSMLLWGGSWISAKVIASDAASEVLVFWRFLFTFLSFIPVALVSGESLKLSFRTLLKLILAALLLVVYNKFFFTGLRSGLAGAGGVLVTSLNPLIAFSLSVLLYRTVLSRREIIGLAVGVAGGLVLLRIWDIDPGEMVRSGNLFFFLAAFAWAFLTFTSQSAQKSVSFIVYSFYVYGLTALFSIPIAVPYGIFSVLKAPAAFWFNIIYLSVFVTSFATTMYFYTAGRVGAHRASSFIFIVPTSALFLSWLILGEVPSVFTVAGGVLTIGAVYLINVKKRTKKPERTLRPE